jgi:uncharacterized integral membrane protein
MDSSANARTHRPYKQHGVIETIGIAFGLLNRRPYLIWILIAVDMLIWSGARVSILGREGELTPPAFPERIAEIEVLGVLTSLMPTLISVGSNGLLEGDQVRLQFEVGTFTGSAVIVAGFLIAIALMLMYLTQIGKIVRDEPVQGRGLVSEAFHGARVAMQIIVGFLALVLFMTLPFLLGGLALSIFGVDASSVFVLALIVFGGWLGLFFLFSIPAAALGERNPFLAMKRSYQVVQHHFLAVAGLLLVVVIIRFGTPPALSIFMESNWSIPFAIVVHSYVVTGLLTAVLLFFRQRANQQLSPHITSTSTVAAS